MPLNLLFLLALIPLTTAAEEADVILPDVLVKRVESNVLLQFRCAGNNQCHVHCVDGVSQHSYEYDNVKRLELVQGTDHWLLNSVYFDAVGKAHSVLGMLPTPVSCSLDDLELHRQLPLEQGVVVENYNDDDVIFDVKPAN